MFQALSIRRQIQSIGAISFVGFVIVGLVVFFGLLEQEKFEAEVHHQTEVLTLTEGVKYSFLNARRAEKDFLSRLTIKYADRHAGIIEGIYNDLDALKIMHERDGGSQVEAVAENFAKYEDVFAVVLQDWKEIGISSKEGLRGALRGAVHDVEERLSKFEEPTLIVKMLMMRRHEKDFLLRIDEKYVGRMDERKTEFFEILKTSSIPADAQSDITSSMEKYHADFKSLAAVRMRVKADSKNLSKTFALSEPDLIAMAEVATAEYITASAEMSAIATKIEIISVSIILIASIVVFTLSNIIGGSVARPVLSVTKSMADLADGNLDSEIIDNNRKDEIGQMIKSLIFFKDKLVENKVFEESRNLRQKTEVERTNMIATRTAAFEAEVRNALSEVQGAVETMTSTSVQLSGAAQQTDEQARNVVNVSEATTGNVQTVSSAAEELGSSITEISRQVNKASEVSQDAVREVESTNIKVVGLADAAQRIGDVLGLISDIAEQTNLLALNATIEAARAGESGKGFAVVASEVKSLAQQTANATEEIGTQITSVQNETKGAVEAIGSIGNIIEQISGISAGIASAVEEQLAATQEIARNVEQASQGVQDINGNIQNVSEAASQTGQAAEMVRNTASLLQGQATSLDENIKSYLIDVKPEVS